MSAEPPFVAYDVRVKIAALAPALALVASVAACAPAVTSGLVVGKVESGQAIVKNTDDFAPGDVVRMWRYGCSRQRPGRCGYYGTGSGVVTTVFLDSPNYALVQLEPGARAVPGDRARKDSLMEYWHPDHP